MNKLPPGESSTPDFEAVQEFTIEELKRLFESAGIKNVTVKDSIIRDFSIASGRGKLWLKNRLGMIIGSGDEFSKKIYKRTLKEDWNKNKGY
jgi:hypothetical protein